MPLLAPAGAPGGILNCRDRLAALLESDPDLLGTFAPPIRDTMPTQISAVEDTVVALMPYEAGIAPGALGSCNALHLYPRFVLSIGVYAGDANRQAEGREGAQVVSAARRAWSLATAFLSALWRYRIDPTAGDSLWSGLYFGPGEAGIVTEADPGKAHYAYLLFYLLRGQKDCP